MTSRGFLPKRLLHSFYHPNKSIIFFYYLFTAPNRTCESGWFALNNNCYNIYLGLNSWEKGKQKCQDNGGLLASLDNENTINAMATILDKYPYFRGYNAKVFVGLRVVGLYQWLNGQPISSHLWHGGAVDNYSSRLCGAMTPHVGRWRMIQYDCSYYLIDYICQTEKRKLFNIQWKISYEWKMYVTD